MKLKDERSEALSRWFGQLQGDEVFATLEDRAQDAGHLEDGDYDRLIGAAQDAGNINLRRHVMYCDTCSEEFLRRAGPAAESAFVADDRQRQRRRLLWILGIGVFVLAGVGVLVAELMGASEDEDAHAFRARAHEIAWTKDDRLRIRVEVADERPLHLYVFLLGRSGARTLHPDPVDGHRNPLSPGVLPKTGWGVEEDVSQGSLLVVMSARGEARFDDGAKRREFEALLDRRCRDGWGTDALAALAQDRIKASTTSVQILAFRRR